MNSLETDDPHSSSNAQMPVSRQLIFLMVLWGVASGIYFYRLDVPSLWLDEAYSWSNSSGTWAHWWQEVCYAEDCGGFLYSLLLKLWIPFSGTSEAGMRSLSILISLGTLTVVFFTHRKLVGVIPAMCGSLFLLAHPLMIQYTRMLRSYSLFIFASALLLWAVARYVQKQKPTFIDHALIAFACLIGTASHVFGIFLAGGAVMGYFVDAVLNKKWKPMLLGWGLLAPVFVLFGVWLKLMDKRVQQNLDDFWIQLHFIYEYKWMLEYLGTWPVLFVVLSFAWYGIRLLLGKDKYQDNPVTRYLFWTVPIGLAVVFCPLVASTLSRGTHHYVNYRYCLTILPVLTSWLVLSLYCIPRYHKLLWIPVVLVSLQPLHFFHNSNQFAFYRDDYPFGLNVRGAADFLKEQPADQLALLPGGHHMSFQYYEIPQRIVTGEGDVMQVMKLTPRPQPFVFWTVSCNGPMPEPEPLANFMIHEQQATFGKVEVYKSTRK